MSCDKVTQKKPEGELTPADEKAYQKTYTLFKNDLMSGLGENIIVSYIPVSNGKDR
jgi:hypothetical protein